MGKKGKNGGSLFLKIVKIFVFVFLLANFCWNGKPLWRMIVPGAEDAVEQGGELIKEGAQKAGRAVKEAVQDTKNAAGKTAKETKKTIEEVSSPAPAKDAPKDAGQNNSGITEEDEKELEELIEQNIKKQ